MIRKTAFLFLALAAALVLTSGDALAERIRCQTGIVCIGTEQADDMTGTSRNNEIFGNGGDDIITANGGDDFADGGDGNDQIFAESGNDTLLGGAGKDRLFGHFGQDKVSGGAGNDFIDAVAFEEGVAQQDTIFCGAGFDTVIADRLDKVFTDCEQVTRV